ncbi:MAG: tRNA lysidine(34) synthetase TilS [Pseudomonadales bacterium]
MDAASDPVSAAVSTALAATDPLHRARLLVGFSGGLDSTVLLHALCSRGARPLAVHVDHGLHPDSSGWVEHCRRVCSALEVPLAAHRVVVSRRGSLEAAARDARYAVFHRLLNAAPGCLLLAHHADDQAETVLLRLLSGRGVYGIPESRPLGAGILVRPLLGLPRRDLQAYARTHELSWVEDPGNLDLTLDRNYLRRQVLPGLRARWPDVDRALLELLEQQRLEESLLLQTAGVSLEHATLPLAVLRLQEAGAAVALLRLWLLRRGVGNVPRHALRAFVAQLGSAEDRQPRLDVPGGVLRRYGDAVHLIPDGPALADRYPVKVPGATELPHGVLSVVPDPSGCRVIGAAWVAFRRGGERLRVRGHTRSLKSLLRESGVPPWERAHWPLLMDERGIAAVPGVALRDDPEPGGAVGACYRISFTPRESGALR